MDIHKDTAILETFGGKAFKTKSPIFR